VVTWSVVSGLEIGIPPAAVLRARHCVARGLCRSRSHFHSTRRKVRHHV